MIDFNDLARGLVDSTMDANEMEEYLKDYITQELINHLPELSSLALDAKEDQVRLLDRLCGTGNRLGVV